MYDVITIGSAFQDVYVFSKKFKVVRDSRAVTGEMQMFTFGTKIELDDILFEIGGGATNTAYTFIQQGLRTGCVSRVGNDGAGKEVRNFLKQAKIKDFLVVDKKQRTAHSVVFLGKFGERTILVYRGASHDFKNRDINFQKIKDTKWIYITSLAGNFTLLKRVVAFANRQGIRVALNPGKLEIRQGKGQLTKVLKDIDILFLNQEEAAMLGRRAYYDNKGILDDLKRFCPGVVVVTEGSRGSMMAWAGGYNRVRIKPARAIDTTGAGDAFGSGFLSGYIKFKGDIVKSATLASNNATSVISQIGAKHGLLSAKDGLSAKGIKISKLTK